MCAQLYSTQLRETMDERWKDWDVVKNARSTKIPAFMIPPGLGPDILEAGNELVQNEWSEFVEILDNGGPGAGYQRLLTLRERMEERKKEIAGELEKWEDREDWLGKLKGHYHLKLQDLAGIENPSAIWRTHGVNDPVEQLPNAAQARADEPIVETFLEFDDDGRLEAEPELSDGWTAYVENVSLGWLLDGTAGEFVTDGPEPRRENITVRYRLSDGELERAGIDSDNLESPRSAIEMTPSTTWREALLQIEEKELSVREEKRRPKRTIRVLGFRLRILENVLYRFETFGSVDRLTEGEAKEIAEKDRNGDSKRMMDWEINAAQLYAYAQEHGQPSSMDEWEEETKVSTRQAWDRLRENDYGIGGTGANGLHNALKEWAPEFEQKYEIKRAKPQYMTKLGRFFIFPV